MNRLKNYFSEESLQRKWIAGLSERLVDKTLGWLANKGGVGSSEEGHVSKAE